MSSGVSSPQTRRALLGAALGAVGATVANALSKPLPVRAAGSDGQAVVVGGEYYDARSKIYVNNGTNSEYVIAAQSTAGGTALSGVSNSLGVQGVGAIGVHGQSANQRGVFGEATAGGDGVFGQSSSGIGVHGRGTSASAIGVFAFCESAAGTALQVSGKSVFSRSGIAAIAVGTKTKTVIVGFDLTTNSQVHCTLDTNQATLSLLNISKNVTDNRFKITLSANVASGKYARVSWVVFG